MKKESRNSRRRVATALVGLGLILVVHSASAVDVDGSLTIGAARSDNVNLEPGDGLEETISQAGIDLNIRQDTRKLTADFQSTVTHYEYTGDIIDNETVVAVDAFIDLEIAENFANWIVQENYGRALFDPFQPARPENWENINLLTTGPSFTLFDGDRNNAGLDLRYTNMNYEIRPFDNERYSALLFIGRQVRRNHDLSLNIDAEAIEFDNDGLTPDFDRRSAFLSYTIATARTNFVFDAGYTEQEILDQVSDGVLFSLTVDRQVSARSNVSVIMGSQLADQASVFRLQQDITRDIDAIGDLTETGQPFRLNNIGLAYNFDSERTSLAFSVNYAEQDFDEPGSLARDDMRVQLFLLRNFSRSFFADLEIVLERREFQDLTRDDDTAFGTLSFGYRFSPSFSTSLQVSHTTRESDLPQDNFDENRVTLLFTYTPRWGQ